MRQKEPEYCKKCSEMFECRDCMNAEKRYKWEREVGWNRKEEDNGRLLGE